MAKRLVRGKHKIKAAGIPAACHRRICFPTVSPRLSQSVYLIFNEGYGGHGELATEAIRLGRARSPS